MPSIFSVLGLPFSIVLSPRAIFQPPSYKKLPMYNPLMGNKTLSSTFSVLCWNIQFCASRRYQFFYDGGKDVHAQKEVVQETLTQITKVLQTVQPDIIALQEVDHNAKRSAFVDQNLHLRDAFPLYSMTKAVYFRSPFVPVPLHNPLGKIHSSLTTLARAKLLHASRHQLPLLKESPIRQAFNLKRAILESRYKFGESQLHVANTHLSAFSFGDGTLKKQVSHIQKWIENRPKNTPWIVMGDLNMLPLGDDPTRLIKPENYALDIQNPILPLAQQYRSVFPKEAHTYIPFGHARPDRKIDYIFYSDHLKIEEARVLSEHLLSDHLPLYVRFSRR